MKIFARDFNGVLEEVIKVLKDLDMLTDNIHQADALLLWQDVRGDYADLAKIAVTSLGKPVYVLQHGRGATRDYLPPNKFPLWATKIFVWGESERLRLLKAGIADERIKIVGCPLLTRLQPKVPHEGKRVLFLPIVTSKEEPENLLVYAKLKEWESKKLQQHLIDKHDFYRRSWNTTIFYKGKDDKIERDEVVPTIPTHLLYQNGLVLTKLTKIHDGQNYMCLQATSGQGEAGHVQLMLECLKEIDVLVCLEEGTLPLMATFLDIPVILADVFQWQNYGGVDYSSVEIIKSPAVYHIKTLDKLESTLDHVLANPKEKTKQRIQVCEYEGGASVAPGYVHTILKEIGAIKPELVNV